MTHQAAVDHVDDATLNEPWRYELAQEISEDEADGAASQVPSIILDLLTVFPEHGSEAAREAARRIDTDYRDVYLSSDPLLKGEDGNGMTWFLTRLYDLMLSVVRFIDYDDARQDALVQLVAELHKLPPKAFRIQGENTLVYTKDPIFAYTTEEMWNAYFVSSGPPVEESQNTAYERRCDAWVNFSSFVARCTAEGFYDLFEDRDVYPYNDIPIGLGLKGELPPGKLGSCRLMAAAQWLLHCGGKLRAGMAEADQPRWNLDKWNSWVAKIREIVEGGIEDAKVRAAVEEALAVMVNAEES